MYAIVEDCETTRALLVSVVKEITDEDVASFSSAEGLVRDLKVSTPDLSAIFLDINLPGITGIELIQGIKKIDGYNDVPIIICSASNDKTIIITALKAGAVNFIIKPFSRQQIKDVIDALPKKEKKVEETTVKEENTSKEDAGDDADPLNE